jgi:AraC-like DNA-binding protein
LTAIPQLEELHDRIAGTALSNLHAPTTARRAGDVISRRLQDGSPRRAQIAADLGVSDHTLQRRLADEGMSFTDLVDATRREIARLHLVGQHARFTEIAYILGYADQSTFFRACARWFGMSPGEFRAKGASSP